MNKLIAIILFSFILFNLFAEKDVTVEVFPHYVSHIGIRTAIPIKVTYTISDDKAVYMPGDEVIIDCIFEYIPEDKYKGFYSTQVYLVDFQRTQYLEKQFIEKNPSDKGRELTIFGEETFILTHENRVHTMKIKIKYYQKALSGSFVNYEIERFSADEINKIETRTKKFQGNLRNLPVKYFGLHSKIRPSNEINRKYNEEKRLNDLKKKQKENQEKNSVDPVKE